MKKILATNKAKKATNEESDVIEYLSTHYLKDAEKLGYTLADLIK